MLVLSPAVLPEEDNCREQDRGLLLILGCPGIEVCCGWLSLPCCCVLVGTVLQSSSLRAVLDSPRFLLGAESLTTRR
jgi:hypothetical protein